MLRRALHLTQRVRLASALVIALSAAVLLAVPVTVDSEGLALSRAECLFGCVPAGSDHACVYDSNDPWYGKRCAAGTCNTCIDKTAHVCEHMPAVEGWYESDVMGLQ